jgi:hypothetical protein
MKKQNRHRPKRLRAVQTSRHFQLLKHRHTGHLTHRSTTSYPTLAMIVLCVGAFLASWTGYVKAWPPPVTNSYTVHASVPGPAPSQPATIDTPKSGTAFSTSPITVSGSCPLNTYVNIFRNGVYSGTSICQSNGTYQLQVGLFEGANQLKAIDYSLTDVPGPESNPVNVTYNPKVASRSQPSSKAAPIAEPLLLKSEFTFQGHYIGEQSSWDLDVEGGIAPYAVSVDWGDGSHDLISRDKAGTFNITHTYKKAGHYKGSYVIKFSASDTAGNQAFLQTLAIVNNPGGGAGSLLRTGIGPPSGIGSLLKGVWQGYAVVVLMLASFWLGERKEYRLFKSRATKRTGA